MLLSTQTDVLGRRHGDFQAIQILAQAGFDAFDFSFFQMNAQKDYEMNRPDFREYAARLRAEADRCGIACSQAHAPFPTGVGEPAKDEEIFQSVLRAMEAASILGAGTIVVHPIHHLPYSTHAAELKEQNMAFYRRLVPYCEKFHIRVACENMWQHNRKAGRIIDSVCSRPEEFRDYLDAVGSPWVVACLDVGHTALTDEDLAHCVRVLGKKHLQALHVHDNDLRQDSHTLPFTLDIDFSALTAALAEIGYEGDFTFEADSFLEKMPLELESDALRFMHSVGRYLISQITAAKA